LNKTAHNSNGIKLQFAKYGIIGILISLYGILANYVGLEVFLFPLYPTYITIYISGVLISYILNSKFTFEFGYEYSKLIKFSLTHLFGLGIGLLLLYIFEIIFVNLRPFILTLLVIIPRTIIVFLILKIIVFKNKN